MSSVYPYREIKSFKAFVQTVLPTVYDDSLSYYELLNKVVEHLNTMGVTINTMQAWINANAIETYDIVVNSTYGSISGIIDDVKTAVNDNQIVRFIVNPPGLYKYVCYYSGGATETIPETEITRDIMYFCGFKVESSTRNTFRIFKLDTTNGNYTEYDYKLINESDLTSVINNVFTYIDNTVNSAVPVHGEYNATSGVLSGADYDTFDRAINAGKVCSITVKRSNNADVTCYYTSKVKEQNEQFETFIFSGDTLNTNGSVKGVISVKIKPENVSFIETNIETDLTAINVTFDIIKRENTYTLTSVNRTPTEVISALASNSNLDAKIRVFSDAGDYLFTEYHNINYYGLTTTNSVTIGLNCSFADEFQKNITHNFNFYQDDNDANVWKMRHSTNTEYYSLNFAIMPTSVQDDTPMVQTASATPSEISEYLSRVIHKPIRCYFSVVGGDTDTVYYQANGYSCSAYKYKENSSANEKVVVSFTDYPMYIEGDTVNNTWSVYKKNTKDEIGDLKSELSNINGSQVKTSQIDYTSFVTTNNKKITGYDAQTHIPNLGNETGSCVADFAIADLAGYETIKFPRCTKSGQWFILYSDSDAWNFTKSTTQKSPSGYYDLSNANYGIINCTWLVSTSYTRIAMAFDGAVDITTDTGFGTFFDLLISANQNKIALPEIRKIYYESTIDISVQSKNATIPFAIFKGETLTFVNNTTGNTALYAMDTDGTSVTISTGLAPSSRTTFTAGKDYYRLLYWSQQLGTVTVRNANSVIATKQVDAENAQMASVNMFESIAAIGDSYTAGSVKNSAGTWSDVRNLSWIATMGKRSGTTWKNYGHGGATTKSYLETTEFANALSDTACDLYFFALGQNDGNQALTIGTVADIHDADYTQNPDTFYGNYGRIIQQIKTHAPNAKLVMIKNWVQGATWTDYDTAIEGIATHYSIPVISPFDDYFFNSALYQDYKEYGHPTAMGYSSIGLAMERLFSKCVVNNPSYFKFATIG